MIRKKGTKKATVVDWSEDVAGSYLLAKAAEFLRDESLHGEARELATAAFNGGARNEVNFRSVLVYHLCWETEKVDAAVHEVEEILQTKAAHLHVTRTQIICGTCAGDGEVPNKTLLTVEKRCAGCGGDHYVLAAAIEKQKSEVRSQKSEEGEGPTPTAPGSDRGSQPQP